MIIKRFSARTEEEAIEAAKKELGAGVVVMNVKNTKKKGFAGIFGGKQVEVTVALEEDSDSVSAPPREKPREAVRPAERQAEQPGGMSGPATAVGEGSRNIEKKLDSLQTLLVNRFQQEEARAEQASQETAEVPEEEKEPVEEEDQEQKKFMRLLYNTMLENEVDEKYANQIMEDAEKAKKPNLPFDYILANVYQKMVLKFGRADGIRPAENGPRTLLFMGPTGVGKTTTIAKIASHFAMEEKKKVALLTADTYRIAAAEQLRTYANILEVPFRVVYTEEEAKAAILSFRDFDYIFIDTAGHSYQNEELLEKMKRLLGAVAEAGEYQAFLVLAATTKYKDLTRIAASYKKLTDYQLIFTKLDETTNLGNMLNVKQFTESEIAYVTLGQNVPDDIELFNPQKTVKQLLSSKH
ncbi:MAG: flagellar biosynthesis protein FlhF [Roseburia sp.]|nr:flagellar biosynthesis protein FlhF [Roseburia sp.]MCM1096988.1 flagellar biosynthesis protein FlhF [Ruminococcus flavefaciens]